MGARAAQLATHLLWINLVTDGARALALGVDPIDDGVMDKPPRARGEGVITGRMCRGIFLSAGSWPSARWRPLMPPCLAG